MSTSVGGPPINHESVNGRNQTIPAVPSPVVNGNNSIPTDHTRKPSMMVTSAGATGFNTNGSAQPKPNNIQFGSMNAAGSPAMGTPPSLAHQPSANLGVNSLNPRGNSPQNSPSPIPQPVSVSGGRPPSTFQGQGNGLSFGQIPAEGNENANLRSGLAPNFTPQNIQEHMRRGSSQSIHSDMGAQSLPTGPGRGNFIPQRGRGSYGGGYQGPGGFSPSFRPNQNGRGMQTGYQGSGRHQVPYQGSPTMGTRSPMMHAATPGTPQMAPMNMMPGMPGQPGGYPMGSYQVNTQISFLQDPARGKQPTKVRGRAPRGGRGRGPSGRGVHETGPHPKDKAVSKPLIPIPAHLLSPRFHNPDLSPESGNFENFLTNRKQGYGVPTTIDPSIQYMYNNSYGYQNSMQNQYGQYAPPSPRPPYQQPGYGTHMQPTYSNQGQAPPSMSRQSSQMSTTTTDRPSSSVGQTPHTPGIAAPALSTRTPSMSTPKSDFTLPTKKSAAIQIKNSAGEIVTFGKAAPSSNATPAASTPTVPTPPSRTPSAADHTRNESTAKSDEEKKRAMQEAVTRKVAEETAKIRAKQEAEAAEQKAQMDKEAAQLAEHEAAKAKAEAEALEKEAKEAADAQAAKEQEAKLEAEKLEAAKAEAARVEAEEAATAKAAKEAEEAKAKSVTAETPANDDEPDYDAIEAEMAAIEAEEARREEEYQKKKAASREAQRKKEQEEAAAYEANMKEMEKKAEEEELAREKKAKDGTTEDEISKKMFAALKSGDTATPPSTADESPAQTPAESGAVTPVSDSSMPPPKSTGTVRRNKVADLTLDTKKSVEPPEPSATLKSLTTARRLEDPTSVSYPDGFVSPNPALNTNAPADRRFKYNKEFLLQFQNVFKEKPTLDWDTKIREALGDGDAQSARPGSARTPSNMGGRTASTRSSTASTFAPMGSFGGRNPLPPGTTSEQRFAASNAALRGAPMANPFAFGRPGSMGPPSGRTPSNNPLGPIPGSPRVGGASRGGSRAESKRSKNNHKAAAEENKAMPLTAGLQIGALEVSSTGWKPRSVGQSQTAGPAPGGDGYMEPDVVQRKVKAALNKMTPEKFEKIADQILDIAAQSKNETDGRTLRQVIQLTFEKATDEAHWAPMYAMFCRKMLQSMSPDVRDENIKDKNGDVVTGGNLFRKYLLNRCQEEFERGWKINLPGKKEGESEEAVLLSDEYYIAAAAKRRGLGLVKFIGELFKLGMLTERIMHECVKKLVDYEGTPEEAEVESLTSLLRTIGKQLDSPESRAQGRMDVYFDRINATLNIPDLPSRLRFMLMDIVDLRKNGWASAADDKGPKTIAEIHEEAERAAQKAEMQRLASQAGGRGGGRMPMGRGDARSFSGYGQQPPPDTSNRVGADDLRRLGGRTSRNPSSTVGPSLGPPSMLGGRTNSGRRGLGPGGHLLSRGGEDSAASSRNGSSSAQKEKDKKDEANTNAFSALAGLDSHEGPSSNPSSPPVQKSHPNIERERSRSPAKATE